MNSNCFWYCPNCKIEVNCEDVTFTELHDNCGYPVIAVDTTRIPTTIEQLISDLEELKRYREIECVLNNTNSIY